MRDCFKGRNHSLKNSISQRKIVVVELPAGGWEKLSDIRATMQSKLPGITDDMIISAWVVEMISSQHAKSKSTVDSEPKKIEAENQI